MRSIYVNLCLCLTLSNKHLQNRCYDIDSRQWFDQDGLGFTQ